ncbi:hypothetical protein [Lentilactobacillus parabuchneri]
MKRILIVLFSFVFFLGFFYNTVSAKEVSSLYKDTVIYKIRRGSTVNKDVILKSFTLRKGTHVTANYVPKEGGWEVSTSSFHSNKYVYYFALSETWVYYNNKEIGNAGKMPLLTWTLNKNKWIWSKPGSGIRKVNTSNIKTQTWITDKYAQLMYGNKGIYYHIVSGNLNGWVYSRNVSLAPHKIVHFSISNPLNGKYTIMYNCDGSHNYLFSGKIYWGIQFKNDPSITWLPVGENDNTADPKDYGNYNWVNSKELTF